MTDRAKLELNSPPWWDAIAEEWQANGDTREDPDAVLTARVVTGPVLEVGCGVAAWAEALQAARPEVPYFGLDLAQGMVDTARARCPWLPFIQADVLQLPASWHGAFSSVACFQTLEHFTDPSRVMDKLKKLARHRLVFSVPRGMPGPQSRQHSGHVTGWANDEAALAFFGQWGQVELLPGRKCHIVGVTKW